MGRPGQPALNRCRRSDVPERLSAGRRCVWSSNCRSAAASRTLVISAAVRRRSKGCSPRRWRAMVGPVLDQQADQLRLLLHTALRGVAFIVCGIDVAWCWMVSRHFPAPPRRPVQQRRAIVTVGIHLCRPPPMPRWRRHPMGRHVSDRRRDGSRQGSGVHSGGPGRLRHQALRGSEEDQGRAGPQDCPGAAGARQVPVGQFAATVTATYAAVGGVDIAPASRSNPSRSCLSVVCDLLYREKVRLLQQLLHRPPGCRGGRGSLGRARNARSRGEPSSDRR